MHIYPKFAHHATMCSRPHISTTSANVTILYRMQGGPQHMSPLHLAAVGGHTQAVRLLLQESADVNLVDK
jgi:hypothetical protein